MLTAWQRQAITTEKTPRATWRTENSRKSPTLPAPAVWTSRTRSPGEEGGGGGHHSLGELVSGGLPSRGVCPAAPADPGQPERGRPTGAERARPPRVTPDSPSLGPAPPGLLRFSCRYWAMMAAFQLHMPYISRRSLLAQASAFPRPPPLAHFGPDPPSPQHQPLTHPCQVPCPGAAPPPPAAGRCQAWAPAAPPRPTPILHHLAPPPFL